MERGAVEVCDIVFQLSSIKYSSRRGTRFGSSERLALLIYAHMVSSLFLIHCPRESEIVVVSISSTEKRSHGLQTISITSQMVNRRLVYI